MFGRVFLVCLGRGSGDVGKSCETTPWHDSRFVSWTMSSGGFSSPTVSVPDVALKICRATINIH